MPDRRSPVTQLVLLVVSGVATVVLVVGVIRSLMTGMSPLWLLGVAIALVVSLMGLRALRRK
jgi:hypothetical protein